MIRLSENTDRIIFCMIISSEKCRQNLPTHITRRVPWAKNFYLCTSSAAELQRVCPAEHGSTKVCKARSYP